MKRRLKYNKKLLLIIILMFLLITMVFAFNIYFNKNVSEAQSFGHNGSTIFFNYSGNVYDLNYLSSLNFNISLLNPSMAYSNPINFGNSADEVLVSTNGSNYSLQYLIDNNFCVNSPSSLIEKNPGHSADEIVVEYNLTNYTLESLFDSGILNLSFGCSVNEYYNCGFYNVSGTYNWIVPNGVTKVRVSMVAGGGSGGGTNNGCGSGGGSGGGFDKAIEYVNPGSSISVIVGSGGSPSNTGDHCWGSGTSAPGYSGSLSKFGILLSATGGGGGNGGYNGGSYAPGSAGSPNGTAGTSLNALGGAGSGGDSLFGLGGIYYDAGSGAGSPGQGYGAGGSGACGCDHGGHNSGAGAVGMVKIECSSLTCTPTTCAIQGKNCGTISDGCGGVLDCGSCASGQSCINNVCGPCPSGSSLITYGGQTFCGYTLGFGTATCGTDIKVGCEYPSNGCYSICFYSQDISNGCQVQKSDSHGCGGASNPCSGTLYCKKL